ncbi:hypothetical protein TTRE_0000663601 [Trichuris trichiura]|uniref:INTS8 TPR repeats domain-containing protein n=1 Tax=Trichuris trichiura TaxID=36087 RepID=A0A077ZER5_TRITR|nr:hypothetical protein TTRE_0000663601 [Trichuris trichiura]
MQALNFLGVDPSPNWIDYYLSIEKLSSLLVTSKNELVDKSLIRVTAEFCEQAQLLESRLRVFQGTDEERSFVERRTGKLKAMGLYVCAHWNWNLFKICDSLGVMNSRYLLEKLCAMVMPNFTCLTDMFDIDYSTITDGLYRFLIVLSARWYIFLNSRYCIPLFTNTSLIPQASVQCICKLTALSVFVKQRLSVEAMATAAGKFLLQFCQDSSAFLLLPGISCFKFNSADEDVVSFDPDACDQISYDVQRLMALFDLGEHYFFEQKFDEAKESFSLILPHLSTIEGLTNAHSYATSERLRGYAIALGLPRSEDVELPVEHVLNEAPSEQIAVFLLEDTPYKTVSLSRRLLLERKASETLMPVYAEVYSANIIRNFGEGLPVTQSLLHFLSRSENLPIFCLTLIKAKKLELLGHGVNIRLFLEFLCQQIPRFFDSLTSCQLLSLLSDEERPRPRVHERMDCEVAPLPSASQSCRKALFKLGSNPWDMVGCTSPSEFKSIMLQADGAKRFHRSDAFSSGALIDFREQLRASEAVVVRLSLYFLDGLLNLNHYRTCKNWLEACKCALSPTTSNYIMAELGNELFRRELIIWHRFLDAHVKRDFKKWTQSIATNVRAYVADQCRQSVESNQTSYLNCLVTCFLVNTSDWEYILCQDRNGLRGKYVDFAKVLAALCFEVSKDGPNTRTYAREFFDIVTTAFATSGQMKRTASGVPVSTASLDSDGPFLNQRQFISMLQLIREPLSISILLSFFCKMYNISQHGLAELVAEHHSLWPATTQSTSSFDVSFLTEALEAVLSNALLVQPSHPFWLRTYGDFRLTAENYNSAMKYYLEALMAKSLCFTEELSSEFFDKSMLNNMIKCSNKLRYHTLETMLCQCFNPPNYSLACKACMELCCWDGSDHFYQLTWDTTMFECVIATMTGGKLFPKRDVLLNELACPELNSFNKPSVLESVVRRRKAQFFRALFSFFV